MPFALPLGVLVSLLPWAATLQASPSNERLRTVPTEPFGNDSDANTTDLESNLLAAARTFDELDDYDTWMETHAVQHGSQCTECVVIEPDDEELDTFELALERCNILESGRSGMQNGVVTFLVTRPMDLIRLKDSMPRLWYYLLRHWPYPVKVFVPGESLRELDPDSFENSPSAENVTDAMIRYGGLPDNYDLEIVAFDLELPEVIAKTNGTWRQNMNGCAQKVGTSYKHMNQFFIKVMYEHPALAKYRYYLRLDADFSFIKSVTADPFCVMKWTKRRFVWQKRKGIHDPRCSDGLWEWFEEYREKNGLVAKDEVFWAPSGAKVNYVGFANMGDLDFFRSERVQKVAKAINEDGRIYLNRWSDQTYYVLLLAMFEEHRKVGDIGFRWPPESWCHKCGFPDGDRPPGPLQGPPAPPVSSDWAMYN